MLLIGSALLAGYGFGLTALAGSVAVYALTVAVWTLGEIINSPTQMGLVVRLSPVHGRGRYQGMYALSWSVASLAAPLLGGTVIDHYGPDALWAGCAVIGTVAAVGYGGCCGSCRHRGPRWPAWTPARAGQPAPPRVAGSPVRPSVHAEPAVAAPSSTAP